MYSDWHTYHSSRTKLIPGMSPLGSYMMFWAPWRSGKLPVTPAHFSASPDSPSLTCSLHHCHSPTLHAADFHLRQHLAKVTSGSVYSSSWPLSSSFLAKVVCSMDYPLDRGRGALIGVARKFDSWLSVIVSVAGPCLSWLNSS